MSKKQEGRNSIIIKLFIEGKKMPQIREELLTLGFPSISKNRIWTIWKDSEHFKPRRVWDLLCNFCLETKREWMFEGKFKNSPALKFKMCQACYVRLLPKQPIKQDQLHA